MKTKVVTGGAGDVFIYVDLRPRKHLWVQFEANEVIQMIDEVKKYLDNLRLSFWGKDEYEIAAKIGYSVEQKKEAEEKNEQ